MSENSITVFPKRIQARLTFDLLHASNVASSNARDYVIVDRFAGLDDRWERIPQDRLDHCILYAPTLEAYERLQPIAAKVKGLIYGVDPFQYYLVPTSLDELGRPKDNYIADVIQGKTKKSTNIVLWENPPADLPNDFKQSFMYKVMQELYPNKRINTVRDLAFLTAIEFYLHTNQSRYIMICPLSMYAEDNIIGEGIVSDMEIFRYRNSTYLDLWMHRQMEPRGGQTGIILDLDSAGIRMLTPHTYDSVFDEGDAVHSPFFGMRVVHRCRFMPSEHLTVTPQIDDHTLVGAPFNNWYGEETDSDLPENTSLNAPHIFGYLRNIGRKPTKDNFSLTSCCHFKGDGRYILSDNWHILIPQFAAACVKHAPHCAKYATYKNVVDHTYAYKYDDNFTVNCLAFSICTELNHCRSFITRGMYINRTNFSIQNPILASFLQDIPITDFRGARRLIDQLHVCLNAADVVDDYDDDFWYTPFQLREELDTEIIGDAGDGITDVVGHYYPELHTALDRLQELCWELYEEHLMNEMFNYGLLI